MLDLTGKTALITGATGGIGKAIVNILHKLGATVFITGTKIDNLKKIADELGNKVYFDICNLSNLTQSEELVNKAFSSMGSLDILVCNAGITKDNLAIRMKNEEFQEVIDVNLSSSFVLNRTALKYMMKAKTGRIINVTSIVGVTGNPGQANYCASKAGLIGMSKALASEVAARNITINCIAPGFIDTPMTAILKDEQKQKLAAQIPAKIFGKATDIAYSVAFLASNEASYITGQTLHVNGGMVMV